MIWSMAAQDATPNTSFLSIPSRISQQSRSASRESFATDASLMSLSSFTSEIGNRPSRGWLDEGLDSEKDPPELVKYKEDILERMLESHSLAIPKLVISSRSRQGSNASSGKERKKSDQVPLITDSEDELLQECAKGNPRIRGSLFKSFSTSDLLGFIPDTDLLKHCVSQAWIPSAHAQVLRCRKKHLGEMQRMDPENFLQEDVLFSAGTPKTSNQRSVRISTDNQVFDISTGSESSAEYRKATSEENIPILGGKRASGPFLRKLKFSREIGRRIRDDLLKKIGRHKQKLVTKFDLEKDKGRPVTKLERNFMIFHWLQSLDEDSFDEP